MKMWRSVNHWGHLALALVAVFINPKLLHQWPHLRSLWLGVILYAAVAIALELLARHKTIGERLQAAHDHTQDEETGPKSLRACYTIVIGFSEEAFFRGAIQPVVGLVLASLLFGFAHNGWKWQNWPFNLLASGVGLVYGTAYIVTGDIWVPIIAHALHDLVYVLREEK